MTTYHDIFRYLTFISLLFTPNDAIIKTMKQFNTQTIKTLIICLIIGMFTGFLRNFEDLNASLAMLLPGVLFGLSLPIANWKLYERPWATIIGFEIVSATVYPMIVVLLMRSFGEPIAANLISKIPFLAGIIPSVVGAGLLLWVYKTFLGKSLGKFGFTYFGIAIFLGFIFFPLMNFTNNFILSFGIWQAGIGFGLTQLHFEKTKS